MPTFHAIAQSTHADKRWKRYASYAFAAKEALTPLVAQELPRAVLHLPIAFVDMSKCPKRRSMRQMTQNLTKSGAEVALANAG